MEQEDDILDGSSAYLCGHGLMAGNPHQVYEDRWWNWRRGWFDAYLEDQIPEEKK